MTIRLPKRQPLSSTGTSVWFYTNPEPTIIVYKPILAPLSTKQNVAEDHSRLCVIFNYDEGIAE